MSAQPQPSGRFKKAFVSISHYYPVAIDLLFVLGLIGAVLFVPAGLRSRAAATPVGGSAARQGTVELLSTKVAITAAVQQLIASDTPVIVIGFPDSATLRRLLGREMAPLRRAFGEPSVSDLNYFHHETYDPDQLISELADFVLDELRSAAGQSPVTVYAPSPDALYQYLRGERLGYRSFSSGSPEPVVVVPFPSQYASRFAQLKTVAAVRPLDARD